MTLHNDEIFRDLIEETARYFFMPPVYIEKDYWVCYVLKKLSQSEFLDTAIFKGGTSLSKGVNLN